MKVLFLSRWYPYPADNGSRIRVSNLIKQLTLRHRISLLSFHDVRIQDEQQAVVREWCERVHVTPYSEFQPRRAKALLGYVSSLPRSVIDTYSAEMSALIQTEMGKFKPDLVIASQIGMAEYARQLATRRLFEEVEVASLQDAVSRAGTPVRRLRAQLTWSKLSTYVRALLQDFDGCTVVSQAERARLTRVARAQTPIKVIPNGVDMAACASVRATPQPETLIYSGALTYGANFDAVSYFLQDIFPLILARRPNARLLVTGRLDGVPVHQLPRNDRVTFTGYLDDVRPVVAGAWVSIVPLRMGGGTRLKVLESMALRTPVVATSKGAEGLDLTNGRDLLIADAPSDFADSVVSLLADAELRTQIVSRAWDTVAARYDWRVIGTAFCDFVERTAEGEVERVG